MDCTSSCMRWSSTLEKSMVISTAATAMIRDSARMRPCMLSIISACCRSYSLIYTAPDTTFLLYMGMAQLLTKAESVKLERKTLLPLRAVIRALISVLPPSLPRSS